MEYRTLSNGVRMPMLGYGVFQIDDATTECCVEDAIASGYRMIDTAQAYGNERGVGAGIKASGVDRDELFIVVLLQHDVPHRRVDVHGRTHGDPDECRDERPALHNEALLPRRVRKAVEEPLHGVQAHGRLGLCAVGADEVLDVIHELT